MERLTYSEMKKFDSFGDRLNYLRLWDKPYVSPRSISNPFYKHPLWLQTRKEILRRDAGCDLGVLGVYIDGPITVHHINPLTDEDIENWSDKLLDPENLICVSAFTHGQIHYKQVEELQIGRTAGDTKLW